MFLLNDKIAIITDQTELANEVGGSYIKTDVSKEEEVKFLMEKTAETYGRIDLVFNNAGVSGMKGRLTENPVENYKRAFEINTLGILYGMKYAVKHMANGGQLSIQPPC